MALPEPKKTAPDSLAAAPALKDSRQRWWLLVLLFSAMLISYAHRSALSVAAPFISADLNLSKAEMGVLLSSFFWVYAFMQMPAGWIVDRFGVRRAYSLGFIFWSLASAADRLWCRHGFTARLAHRHRRRAGNHLSGFIARLCQLVSPALSAAPSLASTSPASAWVRPWLVGSALTFWRATVGNFSSC